MQQSERNWTILFRHWKGSLNVLSSRVIGVIVKAALRIKVSHKGVDMSASASDESTDALNKQTKAMAARVLHLMAQLGS
jgi:hypothetical protein